MKTTSNLKLYPVRVQLLLSKDQSRKLAQLAKTAKTSMGAIVRSLIDEAN